MCRLLLPSLVFCFLSCAVSAGQDDPIKELKKNQPRPVAALIDRIVDCNHWLGEPPYDEDRAREIKQAVGVSIVGVWSGGQAGRRTQK